MGLGGPRAVAGDARDCFPSSCGFCWRVSDFGELHGDAARRREGHDVGMLVVSSLTIVAAAICGDARRGARDAHRRVTRLRAR
jgi:hypothetical protein